MNLSSSCSDCAILKEEFVKLNATISSCFDQLFSKLENYDVNIFGLHRKFDLLLGLEEDVPVTDNQAPHLASLPEVALECRHDDEKAVVHQLPVANVETLNALSSELNDHLYNNDDVDRNQNDTAHNSDDQMIDVALDSDSEQSVELGSEYQMTTTASLPVILTKPGEMDCDKASHSSAGVFAAELMESNMNISDGNNSDDDENDDLENQVESLTERAKRLHAQYGIKTVQNVVNEATGELVQVTNFSCKLCLQSFHGDNTPDNVDGYVEILSHFRTVHSVPIVECVICGQKCPDRVSSEIHMSRRHSIAKKNSGRYMKIGFDEGLTPVRSHEPRAADHAQTARPVAIEKCFQCEQKFRGPGAKALLRRHVDAVHLGLKFRCTVCGHKGTNRSRMSLHVRLQHDVSKRDSRKHVEPVFMKGTESRKAKASSPQCRICGLKFRGLRAHDSLERHINTFHCERKFSCTVCQMEYASYDLVMEHVRTDHDLPHVKDVLAFYVKELF